MISGQGNGLLEPAILIPVQEPSGAFVLVESVLDTGFNGDMSLSAATNSTLQLRFLTRHSAYLANGSLLHVDVFHALVEWDGQQKRIEVESLEGCSLLGTRLLQGHDVEIEFVLGGAVRIRPRTP